MQGFPMDSNGQRGMSACQTLTPFSLCEHSILLVRIFEGFLEKPNGGLRVVVHQAIEIDITAQMFCSVLYSPVCPSAFFGLTC